MDTSGAVGTGYEAECQILMAYTPLPSLRCYQSFVFPGNSSAGKSQIPPPGLGSRSCWQQQLSTFNNKELEKQRPLQQR